MTQISLIGFIKMRGIPGKAAMTQDLGCERRSCHASKYVV